MKRISPAFVPSLLCLAWLFAPASNFAQQGRTIPLYTDTIPNSRPSPNQEKEEITDAGIRVISKISRPTLTIFSPSPDKANGAAVIICPGGGYWVEAADLEGTDFAKRLAENGIVGIVLKYRLPSDETMVRRSIGALQDAQRALQLVRQRAADWHIDPEHIGIMGFSAGGHLAAMAATHFNTPIISHVAPSDIRPDFLILGYPVITCRDLPVRHTGSCEQLIGKHPDSTTIATFSNELQVTAQTPPAFLVHASDDTGVPPDNSILFYEALLRHHVPAELHLFEHGGHGFGMQIKGSREDWFGACLQWIRANGWTKTTRTASNPTPDAILPTSEDYSVAVNGHPAHVYASPIPASFCSFDLDHPSQIVIKTTRDIKWVDVRPHASGIIPIFHDSIITLTLTKPVTLSIELNGSRQHPLFLFADAPETDRPHRDDPNVTWFAAGKVYHPGIIRLTTNQSIYIERGAVVQGVILAEKANHVRVCGQGILDGTLNQRFPAATDTTYRRFLEFRDCQAVRVDGVTLLNSTSWDIVPIHCDSVHIHGVRILSDHDSDDGIDIVRCKHVRIDHSFIRTKDDCIAVKSNFDYPPSAGVDDVRVEDCVFWNGAWGNALEIGFELNSSFVKNIVFEDCDLIHVQDGAALSIHNGGVATVSHVRYHNIRIEDATQKLFDLAIFRSSYSPDSAENAAANKRLYLHGAWDGVLKPENKTGHAAFRGRIADVRFDNIQVTDGLFPYSIICGYDPRHAISDIAISRLFIHGRPVRTSSDAHLSTAYATGIHFK